MVKGAPARTFLLAVACGFALIVPAGAGGDELPRRGMFGVRVAAAPAGTAGVLIEALVPGAPAERVGILPGDVLLEVNGRKVEGVDDFLKTMARMTAAQRVDVTMMRGAGPQERSVTLAERPRDRDDTFEVLYHHVVSRGVRIRTIVTKPHASGKYPVVCLIPGLGVATVDQPLSGPEPYNQILKQFAQSGYVTLRVEKPGIGDSEGGPYADTDFGAELDIYRSAVAAVKRYDFVDADNVFIVGHSMGGVFGPIVASEMPVKGLAVYGTAVKTWIEYFLENWRRQAALESADPAAIHAMLRDLAAALHYLLVDGKPPDDIVRARPELRSILRRLLRDGRIDGRAIAFWSQLAQENLPSYWAKGNAHVLAIWAKNDFIATEADHVLIAEIVNKARPGKGRYLALDGIDHGFRKTTSAEDSFRRWKSPGGEFEPRIVVTLKDWMERIRHGP